jgi:hypothetical protein
MPPGRVDQTNVPDVLRDLLKRVRALEAVPVSSGGGLQFNSGTYGADNVGDWLVVETTSFGGSQGAGVYFHDQGGGGMIFQSTSTGSPDASGVALKVDGNYNAGIQIEVIDGKNNGGALISVNGDGNNGIQILESGDSTNGIQIQDTSTTFGGIKIQTSTDLLVTVAGSGTGIFTLQGLPTTNPGGTNRVWRNSGVLSIT